MKKSIVIGSIVALMLLSTAISAKAFIPGPGTQVAIVPGPSSDNGGTLPSSDAVFANFTFTNLPWENLTAGNLTSYQIVVLLFGVGDVISAQQATDLNTWVNGGGKLIIYDSEMTARDYAWLPYPFTTNNAGAGGTVGSPITYMESDTLGSTDPLSSYYINTTQSDVNVWEDAVGDCNVFVTQDVHWCGHIEATNGNGATGFVHTYAVYGDGLMIYNGFDIDYLYSDSVPGIVGIDNLAKLWLQELQQPWGADYNLPCQRTVVQPVGGEILDSPMFPNFAFVVVAVTLVLAAFALLSKKLLHIRFPRLLT